jgi:tetratricopeptide (TPR) repeat protein
VLLAADAIGAETRGDLAGAVRAHGQLLARKPEDSLRRYNFAHALFRAGRLREALEQAHLAFHGTALDGSLQLPENDSSTRRRAEKALLLGLIHEQLGNARLAQDYFARCLVLNPGEPLARAKLNTNTSTDQR